MRKLNSVLKGPYKGGIFHVVKLSIDILPSIGKTESNYWMVVLLSQNA